MRNKMVKKIITSIISLSIISSVASTMQLVNAASDTTGLYSSPAVYVNDTFPQASALGTETRLTDSGEPVVTASGWDVSGGGYLTGKNSGGSFEFVDNSTSKVATMIKKIPEISSGMVQWEFAAKPKDVESNFYVMLNASDGSAVVALNFNKGKLKINLASLGKYVDIENYAAKETVKLKVYLNLNDSTVMVYLNGVRIDDGWKIASGKTICQAKIQASKTNKGALNILEFKVSKDYILDESFSRVEFPREWNNTITYPMRGQMYSQATLAVGKMAERDISHGNVARDEKVEFHYRFKSDALVNAEKVMDIQAKRAYDNLLPDGLANCDTASALGSVLLDSGNQQVFNYTVVNDSTTVDGKSVMSSVDTIGPNSTTANSKKYANILFTYSIPYSTLQESGNKFNLSFDIKKTSDLFLKYSNGVEASLYTYRIRYFAEYTDASGNRGSTGIVDWYTNTPRYTTSTDWQHTSYNFDIDYSTVEAAVLETAGAGATINNIEFLVYSNLSENSKITSGSFWLDNICFAPIEDSASVMTLNLTSDGKITLTGSGAAQEIGTYRADLWQNVRITYDRGTGKATVRHNHLTETVVPVNNIAPENLIFSNNGTGTITVDDITVKKVYDEPDDYVPMPVKPEDDGYYSSLLSCALWSENGSRIWDAISGFDERTPVLGFYDEGNPEVSDWEIKYMVEHGIDSQIFCWFEGDKYNSGGAIPAFKDAKYSDMLDYSLMWTNTGNQYIAAAGEAFRTVFREQYVPYWIDNYFKDNNYTKIDGKPVLYIFSGNELLSYLGGGDVATVTEELKYLNDECAKAGLNGIKVFIYNPTSGMIDGTYAVGTFTYGYNERNPQALDSKWSDSEKDSNTALPVLGLHHNSEAWNGIVDQCTTPAEYEQLAKEVKSRMENWNYSKMYTSINGDTSQKLLVMDNWNEYGEGHWLMPTKTFGFTYLDVFRSVFTGAGEHKDVIPDANQLERINRRYDQSRRRREGSNVASSDEKHNIVKLWDFTKPGMTTSNIGEGGLEWVHMKKIGITEGKGIQGTTKNGHAYVGITGLNIDLESTGIDSVYIRSNENVDFSYIFPQVKYTNDEGETVTVTGWSTGKSFDADWNSDVITERVVCMEDYKHWKGTLTGLGIRNTHSIYDTFTVEAIGLAKSNMFDLGEELIVDGSFEKDTAQYTCEGVTAEVNHFDFNRGAESLKISGNGTVKLPVESAKANTAYQLEAFAKLPFGDTTQSSLTAYLSYTADGAQKISSSVTLPKFSDQGYARLYDVLEIKEDAPISDVKLCITNTGGTTYYLDDISLRVLSSNYTKTDSTTTDGVRNGFYLHFNENVDTKSAEAICNITGEKLSVSQYASNVAFIGLPEASAGKDKIILSGITTACGEEIGIITIDIQNGIDSIAVKYYTNYGTDSQAEVTQADFEKLVGTKVTGVIKLSNNSTTTVTGNVFSAFYSEDALLNAVLEEFSASGSTPATITYELEVPSEFDSYKEFVWSTEMEPLLK